MYAWVRRFEQGALYFGAAILLIMMGHIVADVTMRFFFNQPITGTLEVVVHWWMILITALGLWAAEIKHDHIAVTLLTGKLRFSSQFVHSVLVRLMTISFLLVVFWFGLQTALDKAATGEFTGSAEIPIWPTRFFLPLGALAFAGVGTVRLVRQLRTGELAEEATVEEEVPREQA